MPVVQECFCFHRRRRPHLLSRPSNISFHLLLMCCRSFSAPTMFYHHLFSGSSHCLSINLISKRTWESISLLPQKQNQPHYRFKEHVEKLPVEDKEGNQFGSDYTNTLLIMHMMKQLQCELPWRGCLNVSLGILKAVTKISGSLSNLHMKRCRHLCLMLNKPMSSA